jgi:hypothetical protein
MTRCALVLLLAAAVLPAQNVLTVSGTRFLMDGRPFPYTGISFFNAIYNPAFNKSPEDRRTWLRKFKKYGINVIRVWSQWDSKRGFVNTCPECSLYLPDGSLRREHIDRVKAIAADAAAEGMVLQLVMFSQESWHDGIKLGEAADRAVGAVARELMPHRNVVLQVWNEFSERVLDHVKTIRSIDPKRLVTNSPGFAGVLGDNAQNAALDYLTPHSSRQGAGKTWEIAPEEIRYLLARWRKPVVDDEPARNGTPKFGGPKDTTYPFDHIIQIYKVWQAGAYITYHHDMFQMGAGHPTVPPSGVPDPEHNPYHHTVLQFIAQRDRYMPAP